MSTKNFDVLVPGYYLNRLGTLVQITDSTVTYYDKKGNSAISDASDYDLITKVDVIITPVKRKVVKEIVRYANIYPDRIMLHNTEAEAHMYATRNVVVKAVKLTGTYEVEE